MGLLALALAGCATQKVDWSGRVGHYTYDQAVTELGPPDKSATLTDGTVIADWMTRRGGYISAPGPYFPPRSCYYGPSLPMYYQTYVPSDYIRLTFSADRELKTFQEYVR